MVSITLSTAELLVNVCKQVGVLQGLCGALAINFPVASSNHSPTGSGVHGGF